MNIIAETRRLRLREFTTADAPFMLELLNSPGWLEFIGDRNVRTVEDAAAYLQNGNLKSYADNGFGFYAVVLKKTGATIGTSGLIQRPFLEHVDVGFAFLPEHFGKGYALEATEAVMGFAKNFLHKSPIFAFTNRDNFLSINLLRKIGLRPKSLFEYPGTGEILLLLSTDAMVDDRLEIDQLTLTFFSVFSNIGGKKPRVGLIEKLCLPSAIFTKNMGGAGETLVLKKFIASRTAILTDGSLIGFSEKEVSETTEIHGNIAHRFSFFEKSGTLDGVFFEKKGVKSLQFVKKEGAWKIAAVAWEDEG